MSERYTGAGDAVAMYLGGAPIVRLLPSKRKYPGRYGPFWGQPEDPRTKRRKDAQKAARRASRFGRKS